MASTWAIASLKGSITGGPSSSSSSSPLMVTTSSQPTVPLAKLSHAARACLVTSRLRKGDGFVLMVGRPEYYRAYFHDRNCCSARGARIISGYYPSVITEHYLTSDKLVSPIQLTYNFTSRRHNKATVDREKSLPAFVIYRYNNTQITPWISIPYSLNA